VNISNAGDIELLAEDQIVGAGATPNAGVATGAGTYWLMSTVVFKADSGGGTTAQAIRASAGPQRSLRLAAIAPISSVSVASAPSAARSAGTGIARVRTMAPPARCGRHTRVAAARRACQSLHRAAVVARQDRHRWVYEALLKGLSPALLCHHWNGRSLRGLTGLSAAWYAFS
jgi:hypothetical protein